MPDLTDPFGRPVGTPYDPDAQARQQRAPADTSGIDTEHDFIPGPHGLMINPYARPPRSVQDMQAHPDSQQAHPDNPNAYGPSSGGYPTWGGKPYYGSTPPGMTKGSPTPPQKTGPGEWTWPPRPDLPIRGPGPGEPGV